MLHGHVRRREQLPQVARQTPSWSVYVFGGAIHAGTDNYVSYLLPGILLIAIASGISYTAFRLFIDLQSGIFERFHSMPIARSSVLWGTF